MPLGLPQINLIFFVEIKIIVCKNMKIKYKKRNRKHPQDKIKTKENLLIICLSYGFLGINFIVAGLFADRFKDIRYTMYILGIDMLALVLISCFDRRPEMRTNGYAFCCVFINLILTLVIYFLSSSFWILILYSIEFIIFLIIVIVKRAINQKGRKK